MGAISTLNAGAEQIPQPPAAVSSPAAAVDDTPDPPSTLPWGAKPQRLKIGRPGASSKALAAAGADAALSEPGDSLALDPEFMPKGPVTKRGPRKTSGRPVAPPAPARLSALADPPPEPRASYYYSTAFQFVENSGSYANLVISKPRLGANDYHSLAEIAVQTPDERQTVEVGWTVNRAMHGDDDPHLFVYHWIDKRETCYNSCGFVRYSQTVKPGMKLPEGVSKRFGIQYFKDGDGNGAWWIAYDSEWVGFFPDTLWQGRFTSSGLVQWFGEVASPVGAQPCSDMGNGLRPDDERAARIGTISLLGGAEVSYSLKAENPYYANLRLSERTMRYGGPAPAC
ncbi:neprosin family prolyl endopeptidase [Jidongwangia harbinensis]|uniref:neprosin family prolyl endopeptidase n=1 Tax=Jidongwangia harbinensis TaxID=2878561 RepID=UPI001CD9F864|nr:neprosin family prolyl endopeptidase [Jidongwangia harbinensis]MCA2214471.1 neprosin family prolyl endopeptidase [Jidongwangia harbinensis]